MPVIYLDTVLTNGELDLFYDAAPCRFDSKDFFDLHNMVCASGTEVNARCSHDLS